MATYEITAEMNLKKIIAESKEVAQALNGLLIILNRLKRSMQRKMMTKKGIQIIIAGVILVNLNISNPNVLVARNMTNMII